MSLLSCLRCATKFAVGLLHCPHCLSEEFEEDGVGKITIAGGASFPDKAAGASVEPSVAAPAAEVVTPEPEPVSEPEAVAEPVVEESSTPEPEPEPEPAPKAKAAPTLSGPAKSTEV